MPPFRGGKLRSNKETTWKVWTSSLLSLAGGWTNQLEKYQSNWIISPGRGENKRHLKPPPSSGFGVLSIYIIFHTVYWISCLSSPPWFCRVSVTCWTREGCFSPRKKQVKVELHKPLQALVKTKKLFSHGGSNLHILIPLYLKNFQASDFV